MHVDRAFLDVDIAAPDPVEQLAARVDALRMRHEELQQPVLGRAERHGLSPTVTRWLGRIELEPAGLERFSVAAGRAPAQHGLDARQQFTRS